MDYPAEQDSLEYSNRKDWEGFVHGKLIAFMQTHGIEVLRADTKKGQKASVRRTKDGEWKVETSFQETL